MPGDIQDVEAMPGQGASCRCSFLSVPRPGFQDGIRRSSFGNALPVRFLRAGLAVFPPFLRANIADRLRFNLRRFLRVFTGFKLAKAFTDRSFPKST
jgi:hypothetical protein